MFLHADTEEFNKYIILPNLYSPSNHVFLSINIIIKEEPIQEKKQAIIKNSEEEKEFISKLRNRIEHIDITNIPNCEKLEKIIQEFTSITKKL